MPKAVVWLCLTLMLASAWAAVAHHHADEATSSSCQVCVVAHSVAPATAPPTPKLVYWQRFTVRHQVAEAKQELRTFALYVRPPPIA